MWQFHVCQAAICDDYPGMLAGCDAQGPCSTYCDSFAAVNPPHRMLLFIKTAHMHVLNSLHADGFLCCTQRRAGAKGFGLFTLEDLKAGQFIIEYIGEVCWPRSKD